MLNYTAAVLSVRKGPLAGGTSHAAHAWIIHPYHKLAQSNHAQKHTLWWGTNAVG